MRLVTALILLLSCSFATAQTITIRMIDGHSGKPIGKKKVTVHWLDSLDETVAAIDGSGVGHFVVPPGRVSFFLIPETGKKGGRMPYLACLDHTTQHFSVAEVVERGDISANVCDKKVHVDRRPGEVLYYVEFLHWWQPNLNGK